MINSLQQIPLEILIIRISKKTMCSLLSCCYWWLFCCWKIIYKTVDGDGKN